MLHVLVSLHSRVFMIIAFFLIFTLSLFLLIFVSKLCLENVLV